MSLNMKMCTLGVLVLLVTGVRAIKISNSSYRGIVIEIRENVPSHNCTGFLDNLESVLANASHFLYTAADSRAFFGEISINIPEAWPDSCVPAGRVIQPSAGEDSDITITLTSQLFGDRMWTQQSGGCGEQGDQIYASHYSFDGEFAPKEFIKEWAKYRYGIFDEIGFDDDPVYPKCHFTDTQHVTGCSDGPIKDIGICQHSNPFADLSKTIDKNVRTSVMYVPQSESVMSFCDEGTHDRYAPTKHNLMCHRQSTLDVVLRHPDFDAANMAIITHPEVVTNTNPVFTYQRRLLTRYVLVIEDSQETLIRESWSFLRNAIRKWVVHELPSNTEIGIVLVNAGLIDKVMPITSLFAQKDRDLVASFVPYVPSETVHAACVSCALSQALSMFQKRRSITGRASEIILLIAPGMDFATDYTSAAAIAVANNIRIVTLNFPGLNRRQPLDKLAELSNGLAFTINERKHNSEKSFLNTYVELTAVLMEIGARYYEGPKSQLPVEIHRNKLFEEPSEVGRVRRGSNRFTGKFYVDESITGGSDFYIYTHSTEAPLIQHAKLISPSGILYNVRSDQRMPVKQLTLLAHINETGIWEYVIDRFQGNPQPHFVQVIAFPTNFTSAVIRARSWIKRPKSGANWIVYCEVTRGVLPVRNALVQVTVTRTDVPCNGTSCEQEMRLYDNGSGDPDITAGDGVYSRYFHPSVAGTYEFRFTVNDNNFRANTLKDYVYENRPCCGSAVPVETTKNTSPFDRYVLPMTLHVTREEIEEAADYLTGRIGDLVVTYIEEGKVRLSWSSPDMGGQAVARYEIKYAFTVEDIVDGYETAAMMWNHETPEPRPIGAKSYFTMDINLEPELFGHAVFFAIRPFSKLSISDMGGLISNPVRTYIPTKMPTTTPHLGSADDSVFGPDASDFGNEYDNSPFDKDTADLLKFAVPMGIAGAVFVGSIVAVLLLCAYYYREAYCEQHSDKMPRNNNPDEHTTQVCSTPATPQSSPPSREPRPTSIEHTPALETPNHHTVGIPIYADECKSNLIVDDLRQQNYLNVEHMNIIPGTHTGSLYNGVSIISSCNNTLKRQHPGLGAYDSWSPTQLLHEHDRRVSPSDELMNQVNISKSHCEPPPVPPLPLGAENYTEIYQYQQAMYPTLTRPHNQNQNQNQAAYNADRKRRNVTMV